MMGKPVEQRRGHLGVAEDGGPLAEGQIGGDDDGGLLVELAGEMEEQLAAGLGEGQIAEFVQDCEVETAELVGDAALAVGTGLGFQAVHKIHDVVEATAFSGADTVAAEGDGEMGFAGSGAADEDGIALLGEEAAFGQIAHQAFVDGRALEVEAGNLLGQRQLGDGELVFDRAGLLLGDLGLEQVATMSWTACLRLRPLAMTSSKAWRMP